MTTNDDRVSVVDKNDRKMKLRTFFSSCMAMAVLALAAPLFQSCGIYSFSGTSIQSDVNTVTINYFEYKALRVNPTLSNDLTEALKDQFQRLTRLEQVDMDGDLEIVGEITGYDVRATAVTADEVAAQNRLTVTVKIYFTNRKYPEDDFEKSFSAYADYDQFPVRKGCMQACFDAQYQFSACDASREKLTEEEVAERQGRYGAPLDAARIEQFETICDQVTAAHYQTIWYRGVDLGQTETGENVASFLHVQYWNDEITLDELIGILSSKMRLYLDE